MMRVVFSTSLMAWFQEVANRAPLINRGGEGDPGMHNRTFERVIISIFLHIPLIPANLYRCRYGVPKLWKAKRGTMVLASGV